MSEDDLIAAIRQAVEFDHDGGEDGYSQSADAMWKAAVAAFNYAADKVGATGFQAGYAALRFYGEAMHIEGPYAVIQAQDLLYPQYDIPDKVAAWCDEWRRGWCADKARELLASRSAVPHVRERWQQLAEAAS